MNERDRNRVIAANVVYKATQDSSFKNELLLNPKQTLRVAGIDDIPDSVQLRVVENTAERIHLVLPYSEERSVTKDHLSAFLEKALPFPEGTQIVFVQNTANLQYIVLPLITSTEKSPLVNLMSAMDWETDVETLTLVVVCSVLDCNATVVSGVMVNIAG